VQRRPWVDISSADADSIAAAVQTCPTGALRFERRDGGPQDEPERPAVAVPIPDGPLLVMGDLRVIDHEGEVAAEEYRLTLCRCGRTKNQPFCDNSHLMSSFRSREFTAKPDAGREPAPEAAEGKVTVTATRDGSLHFEGRLVVMSPDGEQLADADDLWLCRCGQSRSKPFCDASHKGQFESRLVQVEGERRQADTPAAFEPNRHVAPPPEVDPAG
jgi:CDGSH-type Zn-finger protein